MKKRLFLLLSVLTIIVLWVSACGGGTPTAEPAATEETVKTEEPAKAEEPAKTEESKPEAPAGLSGKYLDRAYAGEFKGTVVTA
ncbi:MAG: carbohydrate ABC transporter substrate-binding protein, partial [Anaerolineae bacterium]|nr:carbohydrate ABC transporter substrate-binding protein [Anaerolineae bacterium]